MCFAKQYFLPGVLGPGDSYVVKFPVVMMSPVTFGVGEKIIQRIGRLASVNATPPTGFVAVIPMSSRRRAAVDLVSRAIPERIRLLRHSGQIDRLVFDLFQPTHRVTHGSMNGIHSLVSNRRHIPTRRRLFQNCRHDDPVVVSGIDAARSHRQLPDVAHAPHTFRNRLGMLKRRHQHGGKDHDDHNDD